MDRWDREALLHRHVIISPVASSLPLKLVTPMLRVSRLRMARVSSLHNRTQRNSNHWKVDCFHTLPHAFRSRCNTMKAIFPVLTPRFSSIALDDDNAHSVVFYCSVGSPGMRLCACQNNILDFFWGIDLQTLYILTYITAFKKKNKKPKHWKTVTKAKE